MSIGVTENEFWHMTPHSIKLHIQAYNKQMERKQRYDNELAHLQGMYYREALRATVGNMFLSKGAKPYEYPRKPYSMDGSDNEEEIKRKREMLMLGLQAMMTNFNLSKENKTEEVVTDGN